MLNTILETLVSPILKHWLMAKVLWLLSQDLAANSVTAARSESHKILIER